MTADTPSNLVPKLRFPEFRDAHPWLAPAFSDLYSFKRTNTLSRDNLNYDAGEIRNIHYGDIHTKFKPLFRVRNEHVPYVKLDASANRFDGDAFCKEGDIVLADASEDIDDVGKAIEVVSLDGERVVAGMHTILATRRRSVPVVGFGGQLFQCSAVRDRIKKEAQGAKVFGISPKRVSSVPVPIPATEVEQQRIADCLGSLDELIAAAGRKLEALLQHKQGTLNKR
ncbi:MAG: restriction endonuclease subunit S [Chloroflexota bacterium]|nr:restriction endonuclease subunit S [Chloroflexota bacterium]